MSTTYYPTDLNQPDGSEREILTASSVKALAATIYEISRVDRSASPAS